MDDELTPTETEVVQTARRWADEWVAPNAEGWETDRRLGREAFDAAAGAGLTALLVPTADGGRGLGPVALARVLEVAAAADLGAAFSLVVHNNLAGAVARLGPPPLRERYLPDLVAGRLLGAFLLTEPGVGSDAAAITTRAQRTEGGWRLDGEKAWVTNGTGADLLSVYATTDPELGHRGIAAFLVEADTPGVARDAGYDLFGGHSMGTTGFGFQNCEIGDDALFVPPPAGFRAAMEGIDLARILVGAMCCGMMRSALDTATTYVKERSAFGRPIADLQGVRFKLADVATDLEASRLLTFRAARRLQEGDGDAVAAAHAKKFATRAAEHRIADCMQVMGAAGARRDHALPRHLAGARLTHYLDGATEIQDVVISRSLLGAEQ
ncbi:MAG: acyl-CoA dehydrogenase family protein [Actinomycetota bacterium]